MAQQLIQLIDISKVFPGVKAFDKVCFDLREGEVHALVGENGAGKSTLMKVLTGVYTKDSGTIKVRDQEVSITSIRDSQEKGDPSIYLSLHSPMGVLAHGEKL